MDNQWTAAPDPYYQVSEYLRSNLGFNIWKYGSQRSSTCPMIPKQGVPAGHKYMSGADAQN